MKKYLLVGVLGVLCAGMSFAQSFITTSNGGFTVTAADGDSDCVFTGPHVEDTGTIACFRGKTEVLFTHWHAALSQSISGSISFPEHTIAWVLMHQGAGVYTWSISFDGGPPQTGTF